jgi:hypothetical protein
MRHYVAPHQYGTTKQTFLMALAGSIKEDHATLLVTLRTTMQSLLEEEAIDDDERPVIEEMLADHLYFDSLTFKQMEYWQRATGRPIVFIYQNQKATCPYQDLEYLNFEPTGKPVFIYVEEDGTYTSCDVAHGVTPEDALKAIIKDELRVDAPASSEDGKGGAAKETKMAPSVQADPLPALAPGYQPTEKGGVERKLAALFPHLLHRSFEQVDLLTGVKQSSLRHFAFLVSLTPHALDQKRRGTITPIKLTAKKSACIIAEGMATTERLQSTAAPTSGKIKIHSHHAESQCITAFLDLLNNGGLVKHSDIKLYMFVIAVNKAGRAHCAEPCHRCVTRIQSAHNKRNPFSIPLLVCSAKTEPGETGNYTIIPTINLDPDSAHHCYGSKY